MFVICIACHRHAEIKPLPKDKSLRCTACGSRVARTTAKLKLSMLNGGVMPPDVAKAMTFAGLISIAEQRGYKRGWAAFKFKAIYGEWPADGDPPPANPSGELMWWIKQQAKRYAKSMREKEGGEWTRSPSARASKLNPTGDVQQKSELMTAEDWEIDFK